jgi:FGGY-family pentulose kinase
VTETAISQVPPTSTRADGDRVIGVDVGTEGVRVGVFDLEGTPLAFASEPYELRHPHPGWAEQDPDAWWSALVAATRRAVTASGVSPESIRALSAGATSCTVVALDRRERPLRPAMIWMDVRAVEEAQTVAAVEHVNRRVDGLGGVSAEWFPCKTLWLKRHEPEVWARTTHVVECVDWLMHRLAGEWTGSITAAAIRAYYDRTRGGWPTDLYEALSLGDLMAKVPHDVRDLGAPVGTLLPAVAAELGLSASTLVTQGGVDAFVAQVGLNVLDPGRTALITGSSHLQLGQSAEEVGGRGFFGGYADAVVPGQWTVEGGQVSTGSVVHWFVEHFGGGFAAEAQRRGVSIYDLLNERAERIPIGSDGIVVLDYWQGNRTPYIDPEARGTIWGLTLAHRPEHVYRAILEGICYGTAHTLRVMGEAGAEATHLVACGGAANSRFWMQMHADVTGVPITLTRVQEAATLGPAVLAAAGAGLFDSVADAARCMVHETDTLEPDAERHREYGFFLERYVETYPRIRELVHDVARHVRRRGTAGAPAGGPTRRSH